MTSLKHALDNHLLKPGDLIEIEHNRNFYYVTEFMESHFPNLEDRWRSNPNPWHYLTHDMAVCLDLYDHNGVCYLYVLDPEHGKLIGRVEHTTNITINPTATSADIE